MSWQAICADLEQNAPIGRYTASRIGGTADWLYVARADSSVKELVAVVRAAWDANLPVRVIGGGANILVSDGGVRGLVVVNRIATLRRISPHGVYVSAGYGILALARYCQTEGLMGFEWAIGVPGTVGGAVVNNAGAHGGEMSHAVHSVRIYDANEGYTALNLSALDYRYRESSLKQRPDRRFLVVSAILGFGDDTPENIRARMDEYSQKRKASQPGGASLGSVFKNPPSDYAGRLIESCGLKGYAIGTAQVSTVHANFFVNTGDATATDYAALVRHVQRIVQETHGVMLQPEIEFVGEWATG